MLIKAYTEGVLLKQRKPKHCKCNAVLNKNKTGKVMKGLYLHKMNISFNVMKL